MHGIEKYIITDEKLEALETLVNNGHSRSFDWEKDVLLYLINCTKTLREIAKDDPGKYPEGYNFEKGLRDILIEAQIVTGIKEMT